MTQAQQPLQVAIADSIETQIERIDARELGNLDDSLQRRGCIPEPEAFDRSQPLYLQVIESLSARIADGTWAQGQAIPSEPKLARQLGVSEGKRNKIRELLSAAGEKQRNEPHAESVKIPRQLLL